MFESSFQIKSASQNSFANTAITPTLDFHVKFDLLIFACIKVSKAKPRNTLTLQRWSANVTLLFEHLGQFSFCTYKRVQELKEFNVLQLFVHSQTTYNQQVLWRFYNIVHYSAEMMLLFGPESLPVALIGGLFVQCEASVYQGMVLWQQCTFAGLPGRV